MRTSLYRTKICAKTSFSASFKGKEGHFLACLYSQMQKISNVHNPSFSFVHKCMSMNLSYFSQMNSKVFLVDLVMDTCAKVPDD